MTRRMPKTVRNPTAVAAVIDLLRWYASDVPPATTLQRALIEHRQVRDPNRERARAMVSRFDAIPEDHQIRLFAHQLRRDFANANIEDLRGVIPAIGVAFRDDVSLGEPPRYPDGTEFRILYTGIYCKDDTNDRLITSDEIYVITVAVDAETNAVSSLAHPLGDPDQIYNDVDTGEFREGPIATIWSGPAPRLEVTLVTTVMERDEGDPDAYREEIEDIVATAAWLAELTGTPIPDFAQEVVVDLINFLVDTDDEHVGTANIVISPDWMLRWPQFPTKRFTEKRARIRFLGTQVVIDEVTDTTTLEYQFISRHLDDGHYVVTYRADADNDPLETGEIERVRARVGDGDVFFGI